MHLVRAIGQAQRAQARVHSREWCVLAHTRPAVGLQSAINHSQSHVWYGHLCVCVCVCVCTDAGEGRSRLGMQMRVSGG